MVTHVEAPVGVLVPVKAFGEAKRRLAPVLDTQQRAALARSMATTVIAAAGSLPVAVVCDDFDVAEWARAVGAMVVWTPKRGLNMAVHTGVRHLAAGGARRVIVAHSDLPLARDLAPVADFDGVTLVPDTGGSGTNVICLPADAAFTFSYGPGSFIRHEAEARRLDLAVRVLDMPWLAHDVDSPGDLASAGIMLPR